MVVRRVTARLCIRPDACRVIKVTEKPGKQSSFDVNSGDAKDLLQVLLRKHADLGSARRNASWPQSVNAVDSDIQSLSLVNHVPFGTSPVSSPPRKQVKGNAVTLQVRHRDDMTLNCH